MPARLLLALAGLCLLVAPRLRAEERAPFESWLMMDWGQRLPYSLEAFLAVEQRFKAEGRGYIHSEVTPQLLWHYSPRWDFGIGYQNRLQWFDDGTQTTANEAVLEATALLPVADWFFSTRQRVQIGDKDGDLSAFFRHRVVAEYRGNFPFGLMPFVADEWFLNMTNGQVFQNRLMAGLGYSFNDAFKVELFGMRFDRWDDWGQHSVAPVFGVRMEARF